MKLTLSPPALTNAWIVEAHGFSGDVDALNREVIYCGPSREIATRSWLEAEAFARAYPRGRAGSEEYSYSRLAAPLFADRAFDGDAPFAWAAGCWSTDTCRGDCDLDATVEGAELFWIDGHGAKLGARPELNEAESALLAGVPEAKPFERYPIEALVAAFEAIALDASVPEAPAGGAMPAL